MVVEEDAGLRFTLAHHYESNVKAAGEVTNAARARRLAQEAVTLSTSLPLSHSSSVFVRCDEDRLDVMKVSRLATLRKLPAKSTQAFVIAVDMARSSGMRKTNCPLWKIPPC